MSTATDTAGDVAVGSRPDGLSRLAQEILPVLYQHRLLTAAQLTRLLRPAATTTRYVRHQLQLLHGHGLADAAVRRHNAAGELLWYVTPLGAETVEASGELAARSYRITGQAAASALQEHTLAINDTGLAFVEHARRAGDECGPLGWDMEVAHRVRDGNARHSDEAWLTPDAVLHYVRATGDERMLLTFMIEVDRSTMSIARLAAKLHAYARYATYVPQLSPGAKGRPGASGGLVQEAWRERYPSFPRILLVLTGAPSRTLQRRAGDLRALAAADPRIARAAARLQVGVTSLGFLQAHGPFAPIFTPVMGEAAPTDVLLHPAAAEALR
ncbi:replication-relaxation family protein [Streptomyces formicae]|uniref:Replication-relaxation family protein n=1 Tax=Streptomyces formicae TaxID=1616117 RepID=A0ABY3WKL3_9ACTN|nr:replication-relaxation family protein [Streptomyces formicae]UNM13158.1 replication-relaxation family protein [Streptomyces formicae]